MPKYVGIKGCNVCIVSDKKFSNSELNVIEIPQEFENLSSSELITETIYRNGTLSKRNSKKSAKDLKIALITNWKMHCGIATYADNLYSEIIKYVGDYKFFIEENKDQTEDIHIVGQTRISDDKIVSCWERGQSLKKLINEIKLYSPDIILIQHEFGLWPNARYWLSMINQLSQYRIIVIMHSVYDHKDKTICEANIPEIVVHLEGARKVLQDDKKISSKVHIIPHGCGSLNKERLWNFYKSDRTFIQLGFSFRYKNFEASILATSILKKKYNDVFFTGILSESPYNKIDHQIYYNELMELIEKEGLEENIALIRGFQSDAVIDSYLRTNKVAVFPYKSHPGHEVFGVSGAARLAMATHMPVITSTIPHFSDVPTIKADTPIAIANELDKLFSNQDAVKNQLKIQEQYINDNSWENSALKYIKLFENN